jgi:FlaG/FlaF family flagellin (archaellin)
MRKSKPTFGLIAVVAIMTAMTTITLFPSIPLNAHAQSTATPQPQTTNSTQTTQIKNYLNEAFQAVESGDNTRALQQVNLAENQLRALTGNVDDNIDDEDDDDDGTQGASGTDDDDDDD